MNPGIGRVLFFCLIPSLAEPLGLALLETPPVLLLRGITLAAGFSLMLAAGLRWLPLALVIQGTAVLVPGLLSGDGAVGTGLVQALVMVVLSGGAVALLRHLLRGQPWFGSVGSMNLVLLTLLSLPLGWAGVHELLEPASGGFDARVLAIHSAWSQLTLPSLCLAPALVGLLVPGTFGPGRRFFDRASIHESGILIPLPVEVVLQAATLVLALLVVFRMGTPGEGAALVFLFPPLAWIAFAYGIALTSLALLLTVAATLAAAATGCLDLSPSTFQALALVVITASALYFAGLVTLQRRAESNRAVQEESYRLLLEAAFAGFVLHQNRLIVQVNERLCGMLDRTGSELLGRDILDVISPKDQARVQGFIGSGYEGIYEVDFLRRDGSTLPVEICGRPLRAGDRVMRMAAVRDISRRRATEDALRESEERYRTLLELAPDGVLVLDMEGTVVSANRRAGEILAYAEEELTGLALGDLVHPDEAPGLPAALGALHGEEPVTFQHRLLKKNTMHIHGELSVRRFGSDRIQVILRDVSERHRVQEALRESEERYRELFRNLLSGFALHELVLDASGHPVDYVFLEANAAFEELTGLRAARVLGRRVTEVIPGIEQSGEGWIETYARVALTGESVRFEQYSGALDRWYLVQAYSPRKRFFVTLFHDITEVKRAEAERRDMEARIQHAQKLESLGVLAGGIAHDFNNLLVGVLANAAMARDRLDQPPVAVAFLDQIERSARRAADLTAQMLAYSGRGQFQVARVNLSELVREMADLLHTVLSKKAILQLELDPELPAVLADVTQVRQVVMNLLTNASDALRDGHGEITVRTGVRTLGSGDAESPPATDDTLQGTFVLLEVHDTGCGMDAETRRRMFEPFFSTKFTGRGLGLAAVQGIVRGHGGTLAVESAPGAGTTFRVFLPAETRQEPAPPLSPVTPWPSRRGSGTVLVVDDEDAVRLAAQEILQLGGYRVVTARDGIEALEVFEARSDHIGVVLLDLTMPRRDGMETFHDLRRVQPELPIVLSSGYGEGAMESLLPTHRRRFLRKPYTPAELLTVIGEILEPGDPQP